MKIIRIKKSLIDYSKFLERVRPEDKEHFRNLQSKSHQYISNMNANPSRAPKINWDYYKSNINNSQLVENMQKSCESFKVPYPIADGKILDEIKNQKEQVLVDIVDFKTKSNERIQQYNIEFKKLENIMPFNEMTMEDFGNAYPDAIPNAKQPSFWPHDAAEQLILSTGHQVDEKFDKIFQHLHDVSTRFLNKILNVKYRLKFINHQRLRDIDSISVDDGSIPDFGNNDEDIRNKDITENTLNIQK